MINVPCTVCNFELGKRHFTKERSYGIGKVSNPEVEVELKPLTYVIASVNVLR